MTKQFKLETGTFVFPDQIEVDIAVEVSKAVSLKRIADALSLLAEKPLATSSTNIPWVLKSIFGTK